MNPFRSPVAIAVLPALILLSIMPVGVCGAAMTSGMAPSVAGSGSTAPTQTVPSSGQAPLPGTGFVLEALAGSGTSLSGSYGTLSGASVPYGFGTGPAWGIRAGKMLFSWLMVYLSGQQTDFPKNTHSVVGFGGNLLLPPLPLLPGNRPLVPYLNATFGASYNTYTGVNAQAGYATMAGAGALVPLSRRWAFLVEADLSCQTAPTGITTSIGNPPGTVSRVSGTCEIPVLAGVRLAF